MGPSWPYNSSSTAVTADTCSATITLRSADNTTFTLESIDLAEGNGDSNVYTDFVGVTARGTAIPQRMTLDGVPGWQNFPFRREFRDLMSVSWQQGDCVVNNPHMFDNIAVTGGAATGGVVNFKFTGTIIYGGSLLPTGTQITGTFSYDTATFTDYRTADLYGEGTYLRYEIPAPFFLAAEAGGHVIVGNDVNVTIWDNISNGDMLNIVAEKISVDGQSYPNGSFGLMLAGNPDALSSPLLPTCLDPTAFDAGPTYNYGSVQSDGGPNGTILQFSIDSIVNSEGCGNSHPIHQTHPAHPAHPVHPAPPTRQAR